jgi:polar amino acid transport system substrate-binding protein
MRPFFNNTIKSLMLFTLLVTSAIASAKPALRVGVSPDSPPMSYHESGHLSGIDIAAAESIGKLLKRDVKFVEKKTEDLIPALQAGEIDVIMSGMPVTSEYSEKISFTDSYLSGGQMAIIRFNDAGRFGFKGALFRPGTRIAVEKNSRGEKFSQQRLQNAKLSICNSAAEALQKLKASEVDFVVHDAPTTWALANNKDTQDLMGLNTPLTEENLAWAVAKNNTELLQAINEQLTYMQKSGMMKAIISKWIPVSVELQ